MQTTNRKHAIVLGGSMAGLFTARILSDYFSNVTIIERDPVHNEPESRKGQPQTQHLHGVLIPAQRFIQKYLPGTEEKLIEGGALTGDYGINANWWQFGGHRLTGHEIGIKGITLSRPFMEYHVREAVLSRANISLCDNTAADGLVMDEANQRVTGIKVTYRGEGGGSDTMAADLVVDACGRGTPVPRWLASSGYDKPVKEEVKINVKYTTRTYRRHGKYVDEPQLYMTAVSPPHEYIGAFLFPIEGDRWIVTAGGYHGHSAPTDDEGFIAFLKTLPTPDIYNILSESEPLSDFHMHGYPASRRFNYHMMTRFPEGLLALGDSVASFNPIYGQGMSSAALQVEALNDILASERTTSLWREFFAAQKKVIDLPWQLTVGEDFRYPETEGKKPFGIDFVNKYVEMVHRATRTDMEVYRAFLTVVNLLAPPATLMHPRIVWRVLRAQ